VNRFTEVGGPYPDKFYLARHSDKILFVNNIYYFSPLAYSSFFVHINDVSFKILSNVKNIYFYF